MAQKKEEFDLTARPLENFAISMANLLRSHGLDIEYADPRLRGDPQISPAQVADQIVPQPRLEE